MTAHHWWSRTARTVHGSTTGSGPRHLPLGRQVDGVSTIGAGDMFAAFMLLALARSAGRESPLAAATSAGDQVAEVLQSRRKA